MLGIDLCISYYALDIFALVFVSKREVLSAPVNNGQDV